WRAARDPYGGGATRDRRASWGSCRRRGGPAIRQCARLYRGVRPALAARADRGALPRLVWAGGPARAGGGNSGSIRRLPAGLPGGVRPGRPRGADLAVLSAVRQHLNGAWDAAGDP